MADIRWTDEAASNLEEIFEYIASDSPDAALRVTQGIWDRAQSIENLPERGFRHETRQGKEVRIVLYGHYRIVYRVDSSDVVIILGIYHGAMDLDRVLNPRS